MENAGTKTGADKNKRSALKKTISGAKWMAHALLFPISLSFKPFSLSFSLEKVGVYMLAWNVLQPSAAFLFPRAEDVLKQEGLDPKIVTEIAPDRDIRVRTDDRWGKLHALTDEAPMSVLLNPFVTKQFIRKTSTLFGFNNVAAYTVADFSSIFNKTCMVYLPQGDAFGLEDGAKRLRQEMGSSADVRIPLTVAEGRKIVALHEFRHCARDNQRLQSGYEKEGDSDYTAITTLTRESADKTLTERYMQYSGFVRDVGVAHDTVLYVEAKFKGASTPEPERMAEIGQTIQTASDFLFEQRHLTLNSTCAKNKGAKTDYEVLVCDNILPLNGFDTDARHRMELFQQSLDYILPLPVKAALKPRV